MRKSNSWKRVFLNVTRLTVLALCFAIVFALALACPNASDVASAYTVTQQEKDDDATLGFANPFKGDSGELTGVHFGYPGISASTTSWTYTETYNTVVPTTANHQIFKIKGDTIMYTHTGDANHWYWGVSNGMASAEVHGVISFDLSGFVAQMIQNDNVTVKAKVTANIGAREGTQSWGINPYVNKLFYSAIAVPAGKTMTAGISYDLRKGTSDSGDDKTGFIASYSESSDKAAADRTSNEVTLDKTTPGLAFALGCGWAQQTVGATDHYVYMSNISVTYTITFNSSFTDGDSLTLSDNAAPVVSTNYNLQNEYVKGTRGSGYAPYISNFDDPAAFPVYFDSIKKSLQTDSVSAGDGKLASYTNKSLGTISGANYYKYAQTEFVDLYNYSGLGFTEAVATYGADAAKVIGAGDRILSGVDTETGALSWTNTTNATHLKYASGIKSVQINDTTFNLYDSSDYGQTKAITYENDQGQTETIGYAQLTITNRDRVVVKLYFTGNGTVLTTVTDYGGVNVRTRLQISGIDTTAPDSNVNTGTSIDGSDYLKLNSGEVSWLRESKLNADASIGINEDGAGVSPYIWFYTVNRADSLEMLEIIDKKTFANISEVLSAGINPIALGEISTFDFDFATGKAKSYGSKEYDQGNPSSMSDVVTGHGYYRFTFYIFDLAGNKGSEQTFYAKVDYDSPVHDIDLSYISKKGENKTITASQNGAWATGKTTLKLTMTSGGFSGYTLVFEDASAVHTLVVDGPGDYTGEDYTGKLVKYHTTGSTSAQADGNTIVIPVETNLQRTNVTVTYEVVDGKGTFTFVIDTTATVAWITQFTAYAGQYDSAAVVEQQDVAVGYYRTDWKGGVKVLIDSNSPQNPIFNDNDDALDSYLNPLNGNYEALPSRRVWYTDAYANYGVDLAFNDDIVNSDYANGIRVYYGVKVVKNLAELQAQGVLDIESNYIDFASQNDLSAYFDTIEYKTGIMLDGDQTALTLDLITAKQAGMRIVYVWAVDQAGNVSGLNVYYVLADANNYNVTSSVKHNSALGATATISQTDEEGVMTSVFKRGQSVQFGIEIENGYVPFKFVKNGAESVVLLENYLQNKRFALANEAFADYIVFSPTDVTSVRFVLDDPATLGDLDANVAFELSHRKVVSYTVTNTSVAYTAKPTEVPTSFTDMASKPAFVYRFVDESGNLLYEAEDGTVTTDVALAWIVDGNPVYFVPVKPGNYKVNVYIPKDNDSYVTDDFAMDESGNQVFTPIDYSIIKGRAVISAKATTNEYGSPIVLDYDIEGIETDDMASEGITVELALNVADFNPSTIYAVGSYLIVNNADYSAVENYTVTFVSNYHTVTARRVTVYTWATSKTYGDPDPEFEFGVGENQFAYASRSIDEVLAEIFASGYTAVGTQTLGGEIFHVYKAGDRISRQSGESVGEYDFNANASLFDVNSNYVIAIQNNQRFNITQRTVVIDVSGQFSVLPYGQTPDPSVVVPTYTVSAKDMHLASEIDSLVSGKLSLDPTGTPTTAEGYSSATVYAVLLATAQNSNVRVTLGANVDYIIYVTEQNAVIVRVKDGVRFEFTFGFVWNNQTSVAFDASKFDVTGKNADEFDTITWNAVISAGETMANAGNYVVRFENAKLVKDGVELTDAVFVESTTATVNPATIFVTPTQTALEKTYGDAESAYGIDFAVSSVNGVTEGAYAGFTFDEIKAFVGGTFARARYANTGELRWLGSRFDDATDANGVIVLPSADGDYYGYAVNSAFASSNSNFNVVAQFDADVRFVINRKTIELHTKDFVGVNKVYDGTTSVNYGTTKVYDLSDLLANASDDVTLVVNANYNKVGSPSKKESASIIFHSLSLAGEKAHNYVITTIVNDAMGALVNGESTGSSYAFADVVEIEIVSVNGTSELIYIINGIVGVLKSDITVSKQYDKTTDLTIDNIKVADTQDAETGIGTKMLAGATARLVEMESGKFSDVGVSDNYVVNLTLFFEFGADTDSIDIVTSGIYNQPDVEVYKDTMDGVQGIKVKLSNMSASITKRMLDASSFESISAVERDYNATTIVQMNYTFKEGALVAGDTSATVGLKLMGVSESANAGNHNVTFAPVTALNNGVGTFVSDNNYTIDVDSLNSYYSTRTLKVTINRAKLMPNVTFAQKEYDDTTSVNAIKNAGNDFVTEQYAINLEGELQHFSYDASGVTYTLSSNGMPDANVTADEMHNVLVSGLEVRVEAGYESLLANYQILGSRYTGAEGYNTVGSVAEGVIEDYEILGAVRVTRKVVSLVENDFDIKDKVYDGTTYADITIVLSSDRVVSGHEDCLEVVASGTFARKQVGNNIKVIINEVVLRATNERGEEVIGNYQLRQYTGSTSANIVERPVVVTANLGSRVYNGTPNVSKGNITYLFDGIIPGELDSYAIQTRNGAYFFDKDVNVLRDEAGEVVYDENGNATVLDKEGIAYNPVLTNKKERYINYVLVYGVNNIIADKTCLAFDNVNGERHFGAPTATDSVVTYYYPLETLSKYVYVSEETKLETARNANALVGYYSIDGTPVYFVANDYAGEISGTLATPVSYVKGVGTIEQRSVYIAANGIKKVEGTTAFEKVYDGTTKFFGTLQGETPSPTDAFYFDAESVANVIGDDKVTIKNVTAQFDKANTDALYVVFSVSGIQGKDAYNYTISGDKAVTVNLSAKITKRTIKATLADGEMPYGTSLSNVGGQVTYTLDGNLLDYANNSFYLDFKQYLVTVGFLADVSGTVSAQDQEFVQQLYAKTYNLVGEEYVKANDGEAGEYIRIGGTQNDAISSLPKPKATFAVTKPTNGTVARSYTLASGNAKNFVFEHEYTTNSPDGTSSRLTVVKRDLYVVTAGIDYSKTYGLSDPIVELRYLATDGTEGIVSGETWMTIFKQGSVDLRPVVKLAIYNTTTGTVRPADKYALISSRPEGDTTSNVLANDEYYVYYLAIPDGVDYSSAIENYNIIIATMDDFSAISVLDPEGNQSEQNGKAAVTFLHSFTGVDLVARASTLEITLPVLSGISVAAIENNFVYTVDKNGNGVNRVCDVLQGEADEDVVTYIKLDAEGNEVESQAVDAGVHEGIIKVRRTIAIDAEDPNGYFVVWTSGDTKVRITIEQASVSLKANKMSEYYNGKTHVYAIGGINNKVTSDVALGAGDLDVVYELFDGDGYSVVSSVVDAGTYRVTLSLSNQFLTLNPNYKPESVQTTLTVLRAIVNVTIDAQEYEVSNTVVDGTNVTKITAHYDKDKTFDISYSVEMDERSGEPSIAIDESDTKLTFNKNITSAGRYSFSVVLDNEDLKASNYNFVGGNGILELIVTSLDSNDSRVSFEGDGILANRLVVKEIKTDSVLASDMSYLEAINQYVAIMSRQAGFKQQAQVAAVLRMDIYLDDQLVNAAGTNTTVSVALPEAVKSLNGIAIYTVTEQGGLKKLTDYTVENGKLTYTTDYVSGLVFVDANPQSIEPWKLYTIIGASAGVVLIVLACVIGTIVRKRQLKKLV